MSSLSAEQAAWKPAAQRHSIWQRLHTVSRAVAARLRTMTDGDLAEPLLWGPLTRYKGLGERRPLAVRLLRMATHDAYHAGQIQHLRALRGI